MDANEECKVDDKLYDRMLYVLGREAMQKMGRSNIFLVGLKGLGVEIGNQKLH